MGKQVLLRVQVGRTEAEELEKAVRAAFSQAGQSFSVGAFSYNGPAPGAFGFGEGFLELMGGAWTELMKVPEAVKILAQGLADYLRLRGNSQTVVFTIVDGQVRGSFKATGSAVANDPAEIARSLGVALQKAKTGG